MTTPTRRRVLAFSLALGASAVARPALAQDAGAATAFIQNFGNRLVAVINGEGSLAEKEQAVRPLVDGAVDVNAIAQFCLGHAAATATPQQTRDFVQLFHSVMVNNITSKVGQYRGVTFRMTTTTMRGAEAYVGTLVQRPNERPADVRWVVSTAAGSPKIVDVVAEGTSLRLVQRSDYASFLSHNNNNVDALLAAMRSHAAS